MKLTNHCLNVLSSFLSVKILKERFLILCLLTGFVASPVMGQVDPVWEYPLKNFELRTYKQAVDRLFEAWEKKEGEAIHPGEKHKVGLKIYTAAGPGLATSKNLVRAVIGSLVDRGYAPNDIFLVDINKEWLRACGYLPPLSEGGDTFYGHEVKVINSGDFFNEIWYYDSPVPPREHYLPGITPMVQEFVEVDPNEKAKLPEDRKSFLPAPLIEDVDFWINLPAVSDHEMLELNGALVNATLWNASNTLRFFHSPSNAPVAVAEMAAIPEFLETWDMNIVSLEKYQFIGGPQFNSLYAVSEKFLVLSSDPVSIDAYMISKMNSWRERYGFPLLREDISMLVYADQLGVGMARLDPSRIVILPE
jgi:hypothetical protein